MTMMDLHDQARNSGSAVFHEFLLRYRNGKVVYAIVEGKQDPMYLKGAIEAKLPASWKLVTIPANGKDQVVKAIAEFDWRVYPRDRVCFFVDRDLSYFTGPHLARDLNLYITDKYSVENDIVSHDTMTRVLSEVLNVTPLSQVDIDKLEQIFSSAVSDFSDRISCVMIDIVHWRRSSVKACLDDIDLSKMFKFDGVQLKCVQGMESVQARRSFAAAAIKAPLCTNEVFDSSSEEWREADGAANYVRGKYLMWLFAQLLLAIHASIASISANFSKPPKVKCSLGVKNAMVHAAPRSRCPQSLSDFIDSTFLAYVGRYKGG